MFDEKKLQNIILQNAKMIDKDEIVFLDGMSLEEQFGLDSLQMVEIIVEIETQFGVEFNYEHLSDVLKNYGNLKNFLASLC